MRAPTQPYPGDLNDEQWELLASLIPPAKSGGRPRSVDMRAVLNALFYVLRMGCAWRWLPHDYPAWRTVYHYFRAWRKDGTWERIHYKLYQCVRVSEGHDATPSAAVLDSQSVKTATMGLEQDTCKNLQDRTQMPIPSLDFRAEMTENDNAEILLI